MHDPSALFRNYDDCCDCKDFSVLLASCRPMKEQQQFATAASTTTSDAATTNSSGGGMCGGSAASATTMNNSTSNGNISTIRRRRRHDKDDDEQRDNHRDNRCDSSVGATTPRHLCRHEEPARDDENNDDDFVTAKAAAAGRRRADDGDCSSSFRELRRRHEDEEQQFAALAHFHEQRSDAVASPTEAAAATTTTTTTTGRTVDSSSFRDRRRQEEEQFALVHLLKQKRDAVVPAPLPSTPPAKGTSSLLADTTPGVPVAAAHPQDGKKRPLSARLSDGGLTPFDSKQQQQQCTPQGHQQRPRSFSHDGRIRTPTAQSLAPTQQAEPQTPDGDDDAAVVVQSQTRERFLSTPFFLRNRPRIRQVVGRAMPRLRVMGRPRFFRRRRRSKRDNNQGAGEAVEKCWWLIPARHPFKVAWDVITVILSFSHAHATHVAIRDREFGQKSLFVYFCEIWFVLDILMNFVTQHTVRGVALEGYKANWARYLTTWFVVDALSLVPGEVLYVQPVIERQNRRGFFQKSFFRTRAVVRVTGRVARRHYLRWFGMAAKQTKRAAGVGASRLLRLLIMYIPKYWQFLRNMKGVVAVRLLRQVHWFRKLWSQCKRLSSWSGRGRWKENYAGAALKDDGETNSLTEEYNDEDDLLDEYCCYGGGGEHQLQHHQQERFVQLVYDEQEEERETARDDVDHDNNIVDDDWDDDDDGVGLY